MHFFSLQLSAVSCVIAREGVDAGAHLAEVLLLAVSTIPATGPETSRLEAADNIYVYVYIHTGNSQ